MNAELVFDQWLQISLEVTEDWHPFQPAWVREKTFWNHLIKHLMLTTGIMVKTINRNLLELFRSSSLVYLRWKLKLTFFFLCTFLPFELKQQGLCNTQTKMGFCHNYIFSILLDFWFAFYHLLFFDSTFTVSKITLSKV